MLQAIFSITFVVLALTTLGCAGNSSEKEVESGNKSDSKEPQFDLVLQPAVSVPDSTDYVAACAFEPKTNVLAIVTYGDDGQYHVSSLGTETKSFTIPGQELFHLVGVTFSADSSKLLVLSNDGSNQNGESRDVATHVSIWNISTGTQHELIPLDPEWRIKAAALTSDGTLLGAGCPKQDGYLTIRIRDLRTKEAKTFMAEKSHPSYLEFNPNGNLLVATHSDHIRLWNTAGHLQSDFACGSSQLYKYASAPPAHEPIGSLSYASQMVTNNDGAIMASVEHIAAVSFHGSATVPYIKIRDAKEGKVVASTRLPQNSFISSLTLSSDGAVVAARVMQGSRKNSKILVWKIKKQD